MLRVLLIFEDYQELALTETYLKKVGFDVVSIMNELSIQEKILSFNPEVIIASGKSHKVSTFSVGKKLKENIRFDGKVILVVPKSIRPEAGDLMRMKVDSLLDSPVPPEKLLQILAKFAGQPAELIIEKLRRARLNDPELNLNLSVNSPKTTMDPKDSVSKFSRQDAGNFSDAARSKIHEKIIAETSIDPKKSSFERNELKARQAEMKKTWNFNTLDEINTLRRQFAAALFKKK